MCSEANGIKRARQQDSGAPEIPDTDKPKSKKPKSKAMPSMPVDSFKGYSLCDLPKESWPQPGKNNGQHGYTLRSSNGGVTRTLPGKAFHQLYVYIYIHIYDHNQIIVSYVSFSMHLIIYIYISLHIFTHIFM